MQRILTSGKSVAVAQCPTGFNGFALKEPFCLAGVCFLWTFSQSFGPCLTLPKKLQVNVMWENMLFILRKISLLKRIFAQLSECTNIAHTEYY